MLMRHMSSLYDPGKISIMNKIIRNKETLALTDIISSGDATRDDVTSVGLKLMVLIYEGTTRDILNHMCYTQYMNKTASCTAQPRERLPLTENAATTRAHVWSSSAGDPVAHSNNY